MTQKYFRGIGQLPYQYFGFADEVYKALEKTKQIQKLEHIYQLGSIKDAYNSEHRRSEYVKIQIALITKLVCDSKGKGLGSKFKVISFEPTRAEILQCLVFLHNIGHMNGTFCYEAGLLFNLKQNSKLKTKFKQALCSKVAKEMFENILDSWDVNSFYKVLIYFNISGLSISKAQKEIIYEILDWCFGKRDKDKIDDIYKLIRIISFLYLDLENSFVPLSLPIDQIVKSWDDKIDVWFDSSSIEYKFILNMHDSISKMLYYNDKVAPYKLHHFTKAKAYFDGLDSVGSIRKKIDAISIDSFEIQEHIAFTFELDYIDKNLLECKECYVEKLQDSYKVSVFIDSAPSQKLANILYDHLEKFSKSEFENFTKSLLCYIFAEDVLINTRYLDTHSLFYTNKGAKRTSKELKKELKNYKQHDYPIDELQILSDAVNEQSHAGKIISFLGSIEIVKKGDKKTVTDFDGVAFLINKTSMSILISESKFHKKGSQTKATKQLEKRMKELGVEQSINKIKNGTYIVLEKGIINA